MQRCRTIIKPAVKCGAHVMYVVVGSGSGSGSTRDISKHLASHQYVSRIKIRAIILYKIGPA